MRADSIARLLGATIVTAVVLAWGCADFELAVDPTGGLPDVEVQNPSFAGDIQPIFTKRCSIGGCHMLLSRQSRAGARRRVRVRLDREPAVVSPSRRWTAWSRVMRDTRGSCG